MNLVDYFIVRQGPLRDRGDLQARRHLRPLGLARDRLLPRRLRRDDAVLQHRALLRLGGERRARRGLLAVRRAAGVRASSTGCCAASIDVEAEARLAEEQADDPRARGDGARAHRDRMTRLDATAMADGRPPRRRRAPRSSSTRRWRGSTRGTATSTRSRSCCATRRWRGRARSTPLTGRRSVRWPAYPCRSRTTSGWPGSPPPTARWRSRDFVPGRRRRPGGAAAGGRRGHRRQDQQPGVLLPRLHRQRRLRR